MKSVICIVAIVTSLVGSANLAVAQTTQDMGVVTGSEAGPSPGNFLIRASPRPLRQQQSARHDPAACDQSARYEIASSSHFQMMTATTVGTT